MLLALCLIMLLTAGMAGAGAYEIRKLNSRLDYISDQFNEYFQASEGKTSGFVQTVNSIGDVFAEKQALIMQASIRGAMGGQQKAINSGLEQVAIENIPGAGIAEILPKSLRKNQLAMAGLQFLVDSQMKKSATKSNGKPGDSAPVRFNF